MNTYDLERVFSNERFQYELNKVVIDVKEQALIAPNEKTIETKFDNLLYKLFDEFFKPLGYEYRPIKEQSIAQPTSNLSLKTTRVDTALENVLIEFKQPKTLYSQKAKEKAFQQTLDYITNINRDGVIKTFAIATDGMVCAVFTIDSKGEIRSEQYTDITYEHYERLIKAIVGLNQKTFDSSALINDFAPINNAPIRNLAILLYETINNSATTKTQMLLSEWKSLFKLSHDDHSQQKDIIKRKESLGDYLGLFLTTRESEYNALFALQTAYSILIKLIAFKVVSQIKFDDSLVSYTELLNAESNALQSKMVELESGSIIRDYGIQNLLEGDFFSWYSTSSQWTNEIAEQIKLIILKLNKYTTFDFFNSQLQAKDFFKNLYQTVMPSPVRHALGEYYTPYWLSEHVVNKSLDFYNLNSNKKWRSLDPTCGSGTFITALINAIISSLPKKDMDKGDILREITSRVVGIDLNPLAVLTARVNYFLNISPFITFDSEIEIPIYSGDSAYTPEIVTIDKINFIKYSLDTNLPNHNQEDMTFPVYFPEAGLRNLKKFSRCMIEVELDILSQNIDIVYTRLMTLVPDELKDKSIISEKIYDLAYHFVRFEKKQWNGIWARIITNYLTTSKIGLFDIIVGNPPWVDWKNLPSQYREKIKSLQITKTIFSGDVRTGGINLNIAALITNVVASNWLHQEGVMGMLMPNTFLVQKTYEGYRNLLLSDGKKAYFLGFDDWSKAGNPFDGVTQKFYTYYFSKNKQDYAQGLTIDRYVRDNNVNTNVERLDVNQSFIKYKGIALQGNEKTTNFSLLYSDSKSCTLNLDNIKLISANCSDYIGREGVEVYPLELMLYEFVENGKNTDNCVTLKNGQFPKSKFKVSPMRIFVEKKYLRPLVRGVDIIPFHVDSQYIVPFAYDEQDSKRVAITLQKLRETSSLLFKHFLNHQAMFESQNAYSKKIINGGVVPFYSMARVGDYTFAPYHVAFRDNTKNVACVVHQIPMPWGEQRSPVFQNHAVTISQRPDGSYISLDEAYYIAGIINCDIVCDYVKMSSDLRSLPIRPRYQIPLYGLNQVKIHQQAITAFSKQAHIHYTNVEIVNKIKQKITEHYLLMLNILANI
ncbi:Eco57I restriction-modification methylase domain-containing protein [Lonepinella koalarum]|uniref:site-specific DNA-methyltransferase (adenine-specific) n=1 Tax=Lonepinella koalarum TaxID=53417 RepID=A0A4V2PUQ6_9PAST|nr:hypothetical protein [Lonepinella koalarum]MDH2926678.1 hypothetical protein [Lonepinella koalarum]TCK70661.1 hypothetical protein EV692_0950 [Lonepinella koalarum]TFJ89960.1 hypothetical protein E0709_04735 [Lonepinella koalarum]